ncbi:MAG: PAS domain-containing sensor histidine kinase [Nitrospina sp.]|nr:MAG: PAS domain-containing sensor histidine kinase [Nitrospina sp.]
MDRIKQYLLKHIKDTIVLSILGAVVFVNYFVYANKLAFLDMFYLLVVLAGYYIGKRFAILGAFFIILMVWVFILADGNKYYSAGDAFEANLNLTVWGGFLILAAWLIGTLSENLRRELQASQRLREDLNHERELLSISNRQLRDYSFRLEERVAERTEELKRSNRELMDFAAIASHDLQEPLRKIVMFGDRLEDKISSQDVKSHDYLDRMRKAARRMQGFIEDLLKLSAIATGGRPFQTVNLQTLAQEVAEDLEARIAQSNAQLNIDHLPTLEADATQMRQLLQNLIGNALKYHRDGVPPVVTVTSRPLRDGFWEIMVRDNGIGIEPHQISRVFQPFERGSSGGLFEGSGMGLAICKKIVDRHAGSIHVASQPNKGTSFIITLPEQHKAPRNRNEQSPQVSSV